MMHSESVIAVRDAVKVFGTGESQVQALRGVSLQISKGDFAAIVGPSGSGKSTLLNIMCGLDVPTQGEIAVAGQNLKSMSAAQLSAFRRNHVGLIFQAYNLIPVLTVLENIEYVMLIQGLPTQERHRRVREFLQRMGLAGKEDRFPAQLSGGQQQRVAVARAMVSQPDLILADEPTANLDSATGMHLLEMMRAFNEERQMTFVFSTHDEKIMKMAKRLIVLADGRIQTDEKR